MEESKLQVHWYKPTEKSLQKRVPYHESQFEEEFDQILVKNQQCGGTCICLNARVDFIDYKMVHFGFSKLKNGGLSKEVLWQLKNRGLIQERVRRS